MSRLREGNVFEIPVSDTRHLIGQVISFVRGNRQAIILVVFPTARDNGATGSDPGDVLAEPPVLEAMTFTLSISEGRWRRLGAFDPPAGYSPPVFRVMTAPPNTYSVMDHNLNPVRGYRGDVKKLALHTISSERTVERVARAWAGEEPWEPDFDAFLVRPPARDVGRSRHTFLRRLLSRKID